MTVSNCCGAPFVDGTDQRDAGGAVTCGICSKCLQWAGAEPDEEGCDAR